MIRPADHGRAAAAGAGFLTVLALTALLRAFGAFGTGQDDAGVSEHARAQTLDAEFTQLQADQEIVVILRRAAEADHATARDRAHYARAQRTCRQHAVRYNADASRGWTPAHLPDRIAAADYCGN